MEVPNSMTTFGGSNNEKKLLTTSIATILSLPAIGAQAATLNIGDQLTIVGSSTASGLWLSGSYFAETGGTYKVRDTQKGSVTQGTTGFIIGSPTTGGANHPGAPTAGDSNAIDAPWEFFGNTGSHYTTVGITGSTTSGLTMSGWTMAWAGIPAIPMNTGAWATATTGSPHTGAPGTFVDGVANFYWSGVYGTAYSLDYRATVPVGDPSGFGGTRWEYHYEGIVNAAPPVPVPAAVWLFGSGLMGLLGYVRRRSSI